MIQHVVALKAEFHIQPLCDLCLFVDREIELAEVRSDQGIASHIPEMASSRLAIRSRAEKAGRDGRAADGKRTHIQETTRVAFVVADWANNVRPAKEFTCPVEVIIEVVVEVEGLASLNCDDTIQAPTIANQLEPRALVVRYFVNEVPGEPLANIEIGIPPIELDGNRAVVGLRSVRDIIFAVAGVIERMRPCVAHGGGQAMPVINVQAGLQRIVNGVGRGLHIVDVVRKQRCSSEVARDSAILNEATRTGLPGGRQGLTCAIRGRDFRLSRLIDVAETEKLVSLGTNVANLQGHLSPKLLLHVQVVIFHVGRSHVVIYAEGIGEWAGAAIDREIWIEYATKCGTERNRRSGKAVVSRSRVIEAVEGQVAHKHILGISVVEDPEARANNSLLVAGDVPSNADPRRDIIVIGLVQAALAYCDGIACSWIDIGEAAVFFLNQAEVIVAQAQ